MAQVLEQVKQMSYGNAPDLKGAWGRAVKKVR